MATKKNTKLPVAVSPETLERYKKHVEETGATPYAVMKQALQFWFSQDRTGPVPSAAEVPSDPEKAPVSPTSPPKIELPGGGSEPPLAAKPDPDPKALVKPDLDPPESASASPTTEAHQEDTPGGLEVSMPETPEMQIFKLETTIKEIGKEIADLKAGQESSSGELKTVNTQIEDTQKLVSETVAALEERSVTPEDVKGMEGTIAAVSETVTAMSDAQKKTAVIVNEHTELIEGSKEWLEMMKAMSQEERASYCAANKGACDAYEQRQRQPKPSHVEEEHVHALLDDTCPTCKPVVEKVIGERVEEFVTLDNAERVLAKLQELGTAPAPPPAPDPDSEEVTQEVVLVEDENNGKKRADSFDWTF